MFLGIDSAAVVYFLFLEVYLGRIGVCWVDGRGVEGRRAERDFMGWRFGVGGVMMFVVVFVVVVVFAPEWKRGEWRKRRGGKGRGGRRKRREGKGRREKRIGEGRREEEGRQEKKGERRKEKTRKERLHLYVRKGV